MENNIKHILTPREAEIMAALANGLYYKEIAGKKFISTETVKKHIKNIYRKLGARNRMEASMIYLSDFKKTG